MIWHDVEQNGEEWDALRLGKATASNFGLIMANDGKAFGEPARRYALQLALEQIKGCKSEFGFSNDHMERGHEQETIARMLYEEMNFVDVDNGGFFDHETYGDSPDGLVGQDGLVEIKSVIAATHYSTLTRGSFDPAYRWQLVGHLDCSGRDWVDFISYCSDFPDGKQLIVYRLTAAECETEIARLRARRKDFLELVADTKRRILELE
ncbi:TPA: YqaJ viral recombinase family protein [Enterobacter hormaechei]|uniref:lambda exonuclease family protein n=2 Tax=Enterobacter hormaechei TaxID=158836 RepID=UPI000797362A|nr:lambda exonuclease family protein [Enterobacter hormaechei]KZP84860.1 YqaJ-like viral recombinase [Enterobacter hormaechei subsp. xiangfangensis]MDS0936777.1 YqaJ viral recombinase family protein [Enterobacter hormaechei]RTM66750.1 YqaJ-like viral recombinase [Enterobacter hormaechei subsp. xiangfangensis]SAG09163.1 putative phage-type endonuclease [Enterobacter hormaechei]HBL5474360.1 YqaJ viral recombinase family protein [Enterobacter hormaechei]